MHCYRQNVSDATCRYSGTQPCELTQPSTAVISFRDCRDHVVATIGDSYDILSTEQNKATASRMLDLWTIFYVCLNHQAGGCLTVGVKRVRITSEIGC